MNNNNKISPRCFVTIFFFFLSVVHSIFFWKSGTNCWCGYCTKPRQPPIHVVLIFHLWHWFCVLTAWIFVKRVNEKQQRGWNDGTRRLMHCVARMLTSEPWWSCLITVLFFLSSQTWADCPVSRDCVILGKYDGYMILPDQKSLLFCPHIPRHFVLSQPS